jgi:hypothetical protein
MYPKRSMYGIFTNIYLHEWMTFGVNVDEYIAYLENMG